jgi:hypothetical protein
MVARLATVSRNGRPHVNPIFFVVSDSSIHLGTTTQTLAARNVRANPWVQILFEVEEDPAHRRIVRVDGTASVRIEPEILRSYKRLDFRKYFRSAKGFWMALTHLRQLSLTRSYLSPAGSDARHCVIEVAPTCIEIFTAAFDD